MRLYLAGPMRGIAHYNYPEFMRVADEIRAFGHVVFNPAESAQPLDAGFRSFIREDLDWITSQAEAVAVLGGWERSSGATLEVMAAQACGIPVLNAYALAEGRKIPAVVGPVFISEAVRQQVGRAYRSEVVPLQVAISGKMKSGKDTVGTRLARLTRAPIAKFAEPLKAGVAQFGGGDGEVSKNRVWLQDIGEYFTSKVSYRHWADLLFARHSNHAETGLIITDLRSPGEMEAILERPDILTVRLEVSRDTQLRRGAEPDRLDHPTETRLDDYPFDVRYEEGLTIDEIVDSILSHTGSRERIEQFRDGSRIIAVPDVSRAVPEVLWAEQEDPVLPGMFEDARKRLSDHTLACQETMSAVLDRGRHIEDTIRGTIRSQTE
jgi:hypothetical protein